MPIIRTARPTMNFYILDKRISEDKRLSWAARGMLIYLLGKPDNWAVSVADLTSEVSESAKKTGRDGTYALLDELTNAGYVKRVQGRNPDGTMGTLDYFVSEGGEPLPPQPEAVESAPLPSYPLPPEPRPVETTLISIDSKQGLSRGTENGKPQRCASRLPQDWVPSAEDIEFCRNERPDLDPLQTASRFADYWHAKAGQNGRKMDWAATWRNWVRNESAPRRPPPTDKPWER